MSILRPIPADELDREFTHYGTLHGFVPVYLGDLDNLDGPKIAVRNGWPEVMEDVGRWLYAGSAWLGQLLVPGFENPGWRIEVRGELRHG